MAANTDTNCKAPSANIKDVLILLGNRTGLYDIWILSRIGTLLRTTVYGFEVAFSPSMTRVGVITKALKITEGTQRN